MIRVDFVAAILIFAAVTCPSRAASHVIAEDSTFVVTPLNANWCDGKSSSVVVKSKDGHPFSFWQLRDFNSTLLGGVAKSCSSSARIDIYSPIAGQYPSKSVLVARTGPGLDVVPAFASAEDNRLAAIMSDKTFQTTVAAWMPDQSKVSGFVKFLQKYSNAAPSTEKEKIDVLIELGVLQNAPGWLSPLAISEIDHYYPGVRAPKTGYVPGVRDPLYSQAETVSLILSQTTATAAPLSFFATSPAAGTAIPYALLVARVLAAVPQVRVVFAVGGLALVTVAASKAVQIAQETRSAPESSPQSAAGSDQIDFRADPEDCTEQQHINLQNAVDNAYKVPRKCTITMSRDEFLKRIALNAKCLNARQKINSICYKGQDHGAQDQSISSITATLTKCHNLLTTSKSKSFPEIQQYYAWQFQTH